MIRPKTEALQKIEGRQLLYEKKKLLILIPFVLVNIRIHINFGIWNRKI